MGRDSGHDDLSGDISEQTHEFVRERLPAYAAAESLRQSAEPGDPVVVQHLATCAACRMELEELRELVSAVYSDAIEAAEAYPVPDLTFLSGAASPAQPSREWRVDTLGNLVIAFSPAVVDVLRRPSLAGVARGRLLYAYTLEPEALPDLRATIEVFEDDMNHGLGLLRITVEDRARDPLDQQGMTVVIRADDDVRQAATDETGSVAFRSVPLAMLSRLHVVIQRQRDA